MTGTSDEMSRRGNEVRIRLNDEYMAYYVDLVQKGMCGFQLAVLCFWTLIFGLLWSLHLDSNIEFL